MAVGDAHVFPGSLTPLLTQLSFQSHRLLYSHASAVRGENRPDREFVLQNSQHQVMSQDTLTAENTPERKFVVQNSQHQARPAHHWATGWASPFKKMFSFIDTCDVSSPNLKFCHMVKSSLNIIYFLFRSSLFPKRQILDPSKLKKFADDNFKYDENVESSQNR